MPCGGNGLQCRQGQCACPGGQTSESTCGDQQDNDCDGATDCADTDCHWVAPCEQTEANCADSIDNDGDSAIDCADSDCAGAPCGPSGASCQTGICVCPGGQTHESSCGNEQDDDCDGLVDCADSDCDGRSCGSFGVMCEQGACSCPGGRTNEASCKDGIDDDCDGLTDCTDPDCAGAPCTARGHLCLSNHCQCPAGFHEASSRCVTDPQPGDIVITEIMISSQAAQAGQGQWFELYNRNQDAIDLTGLVIQNQAGQTDQITDTTVIQPHSFFLFAVSDATDQNGNIDPDSLYGGVPLSENADTLILSFSGQELDRVQYDASFPDRSGRSLNLDPAHFNATTNDTAANWCSARRLYNTMDSGTPKGPNDECLCLSVTCPSHSSCIDDTGFCPCDAGYYDRYENGACVPGLTVTDCRLMNPKAVSVQEGQSTEILSSAVTIPGETDQAGKTIGVLAQVGYGPEGSDPSTPMWTWTNATYARDDSGQDVYNSRILADQLVSQTETFDFAFRFSGDGGAIWTYCDGTGGAYLPSDAGQLVVGDFACPPDDQYEPDDTRLTAHVISEGVIDDGKICTNNDDWYKISVPTGHAFLATLDLLDLVGDIDLALYDRSNMLVDSSTGIENHEAVGLPIAAGGDYYLRVYGAQGFYLLDVDIDPAQDVCRFASDCPDTTPICVQRTCRRCQFSDECAPLVCNIESGACVACVSSSDCPQGYACENKTCTLFGSHEYPADDLPIAIPDNDPSGIQSVVTVTDDMPISKLYLSVDVDHSWIGDLVLTLTSPIGTTVVLHNRSGGSTMNLVGTYGMDLVVDGPGSLDDFFGESTAGDWTLKVSDEGLGVQGQLEAWTLIVVP